MNWFKKQFGRYFEKAQGREDTRPVTKEPVPKQSVRGNSEGNLHDGSPQTSDDCNQDRHREEIGNILESSSLTKETREESDSCKSRGHAVSDEQGIKGEISRGNVEDSGRGVQENKREHEDFWKVTIPVTRNFIAKHPFGTPSRASRKAEESREEKIARRLCKADDWHDLYVRKNPHLYIRKPAQA